MSVKERLKASKRGARKKHQRRSRIENQKITETSISMQEKTSRPDVFQRKDVEKVLTTKPELVQIAPSLMNHIL